MPSRRIVDAGNDPLSGVPIVRYVRGQNERGYRTCSLMAWSAWVSDNQAKLTGFRAEFPSSGLDTEERKTGKGGK